MYLPDSPRQAYQELLEALEREFTYTCGGCTIQRNLEGSYLTQLGSRMRDRINLIYTDTRFTFERDVESLSRYAEQLHNAASAALEEEAVLVAVLRVYHAE